MHQFLIVDKNYKCGRFYRNLCHVEDLQSSTTVGRRLLESNCLGKDLIEDTRLDTKCLILNNCINILKKFWKSIKHCHLLVKAVKLL